METETLLDKSFNSSNILPCSFDITFDFRSFSPDGMFFYLTNGQQTHFVAGQLKAGQVVVTYNDRRGIPLRILTSHKYSDGDWHSVSSFFAVLVLELNQLSVNPSLAKTTGF